MSSCSKKAENFMNMETFDQLDEVARFLTFVADEEHDLKESCGLKKEEALRMMQALHPRLDSEIAKLKDNNLNISTESCRATCHCAAYSDLYSNEKIKNSYLDEFSKTSKAEKINCAQKSAKWLCSSNILKELKTESQVIPTGL